MRIKMKIVSILLLLCLIVSMMLPAVSAATGTLGKNTASRHITCTSLSSQAQAYYTAGTYDYATISAMHGVHSTDSWTVTQNNPVYTNLQQLMVNTHTNTSVVYSGTSSGSLAYYWNYTDTVNGGSNYLLFYCDKLMSQVHETTGRDGMEREHVWCKSKADYVESSNSGGADLHHLRPSYGYINGIKSNRSFGNVTNGTACTLDGVSVFTYASNTETGVMEVNDNIKGDIARILLYVYVRWGQPNLYTSYGTSISQKLKTAGVNTSGTINGSDDGTKIIDDLDTLLEWMEIDPVDTWEMQRNDQIENVQGNRNVFIDYPEYAWIMFGMADQMPTDMDTPSGMAKQGATTSYKITTVAVNNSSWGSAAITNDNTVTVTPNAGYRLNTATATSGTVSVNGNVITVTDMTSNTTVNVILEQIPQYTVSYNVVGSITSSATCNQGSSITLPSTAANVEGYTFIGWTTAPVAPENTTMPTVLTGSYTPNSNITLYAVYSHTEQGQGAESTSYQLISDPVDVTSGNYVITWNDTLFFPSETTSVKNPSARTGIAVSNNQLTNTVTNEMIWTFTGDNTDGFVISHTFGDNTYYIHATNTAQGITVKNADETPNHWKVITDATCGMLLQGISDVNRYLAVFTNANANSWRFYNTDSNYKGTLRLYKEIAGFTPATYYTTNPICTHPSTHLENATAATCTAAGYTGDTVCDICGETIASGSVIPAARHTAVTDAAVAATCTDAGKTEGSHCSVCGTVITAQQTLPALGHSYNSGVVTTHATCATDGVKTYTCSRCDAYYTEVISALGHDYNTNGICTACSDKLIDIVSASLRLDEDIDVIYTAKVPEGATASMTFTMDGKSVTVNDDGTHTFVFKGVNPQCMGDNISATLNVTADGKSYSCTKAEYSVRQYCVNKLADTSVTGELRTLISDVLAYGAASQTYMSYNTSAPVNAGSDIKNPTCSTYKALSGYASSFSGTAAEDVCWVAAGLTLTNSVAMTFRFYAESVENLTVKVSINGRTQTFSEFAAVGDGVYEISFTGIKATEFADTVTASFYRNGTQVGNTVSYSVNTYICAKQADSNANLAALVKALYNYGASAAAYAD